MDGNKQGRLMSRSRIEANEQSQALYEYLWPLILGNVDALASTSIDTETISKALTNEIAIDEFIQDITTYFANIDEQIRLNDDTLTLLFTDNSPKGFMVAMRKRTKLLGEAIVDHATFRTEEVNEIFDSHLTTSDLSLIAESYYGAIIRYLGKLANSNRGILSNLEPLNDVSTSRQTSFDVKQTTDTSVPSEEDNSENEKLVQSTLKWISQDDTKADIMTYVDTIESFFIVLAHQRSESEKRNVDRALLIAAVKAGYSEKRIVELFESTSLNKVALTSQLRKESKKPTVLISQEDFILPFATKLLAQRDDVLALAQKVKKTLISADQVGFRIQDILVILLEKQRYDVEQKTEYIEDVYDSLFHEQSSFLERLASTTPEADDLDLLNDLLDTIEDQIPQTCQLFKPSETRKQHTISSVADTVEYLLGDTSKKSDIATFLHLYKIEEDITSSAIGLINQLSIERTTSVTQQVTAYILSQHPKWNESDHLDIRVVRREIKHVLNMLQLFGRQASSVFDLIIIRKQALQAKTPPILSGVSSPIRPQSLIEISDDDDDAAAAEQYDDWDTQSDIGYLHTTYSSDISPKQLERLRKAQLHHTFTRLVTAVTRCRQTNSLMNEEVEEEEEDAEAPIETLDVDEIDDTILGDEYINAIEVLGLLMLFFAYYDNAVDSSRNAYRDLEWGAIVERCLDISTLVFLDDQGSIDEVKVRGLQYAQKLNGVIALIVGADEREALPVTNEKSFYTCVLNYVRLFVDLVNDLQADYNNQSEGNDVDVSKTLKYTYTKYTPLFNQLFRQVYRSIIRLSDNDTLDDMDIDSFVRPLLQGVRETQRNNDEGSLVSSDLTSISELDSIFSKVSVNESFDEEDESFDTSDESENDLVTPIVVGAKRKRPATQLNAAFKVKFNNTLRPKEAIQIYDWQLDIQRTMTWRTTAYAKERRPSTFLYCDAGTGKTITTILCLEEMARLVLVPHQARNKSRQASAQKKNLKGTKKALLTIVIVANETAQQSWRAEFHKVSTYLKALKDARIDINLMTYEKFENLNTSRFDPCVIVIDEVHHYRTRNEAVTPNLDAVRINVINKCARANQVLLLSATPIEYGLEDFTIYYLMLLGITYDDVVYKRVFDYFKQISNKVLKGNQTFSSLSKQFYDCLKCRLIRIKKVEDSRFVNYNDPIRDKKEVGIVRLTLNAVADEVYQEAEDQDEKDGNHGFKPKSRAALNKVEHKADAIVQILKNHKTERQRRNVPMKVLIYSFFLENGGQIVYDRLKNMSEWQTRFLKERLDKEAINTFNLFTSDIEVIIISSKTSEGLNLKNISLLIIMEPPFTLDRYDQIIGRVARSGGHADTPDDLLTARVIMFTESRPDKTKLTISDRIIRNLKDRLVLQEWFSETAVSISNTTLNDRQCMKTRPSICAPSMDKK